MIRIPAHVTRQLYDALHCGELHPAWTTGPEAALRLHALLHLILTAMPDQHGRGLLFGAPVMAALLGYPNGARRHDLDLLGFLQRLVADLPDGHLVVAGHVPPQTDEETGEEVTGRATAIAHVEVPGSVRDAAAFDRRNFHRAPLHHYCTGGQLRLRRHRKIMIERDLLDAQARMAPDTPAAVAEVVHYLNARSPRLFSERVEAGKGAVMDVLLREPFVTDEDRFVPLTGLVRGLVEQPVPLYTTSRRTQRLVAYGEGLHTAPTWMRRMFLRDLFELDAAQAQLALAAAVWDVPSVREYLATGASFWADAVEHLVHEFRLHRYDQNEHFSGVKQTLKTATYSACFGMSERNLVRFGNPSSLGPKDRAQRRAELAFLRHVFGAESAEEVGRVFVTHRVIAELLRARRARMEAVIVEGGLTDVFGRSYAIGDEIDGRRVTVRTCLAAEMQAAEAYVMLPVARVFLDEEAEARASGRRAEAEIALWQSDGLTLRLQRGKRDADRWIGRAADALQDGCRALEAALGCPAVHSRLEVKYDPRLDDPTPR